MLQLILYVVGNLAGSFFCSLSEAALLSTSEARIRVRVENGEKGADRLLALKREPGRTLASIVILNNIFAIAGTAAISAYATTVIDSTGGMFAFIAAQTLAIIAFGEIVPKVLGEALPEPIAMLVAPLLQWVSMALRPLVLLVDLIVGWAKPSSRVLAGGESEIKELARLGEEGGHIASREVELIQRVFRLDDITAEDVMTPRRLIRGFKADTPLASIREILLSANHAQFPIYDDDLDAVTGILARRDALVALATGGEEKTVGEFKRKALFVPTSKKVDDVLRDVQRAHGRMAVVIDEYGVTEGIVTMDDLVEELVGEAIDELDVTEGLVKRLSRTEALVHGLTRIRDVARFLNCDVVFADEEEENTTVTGILQARLDRIPVSADVLELEGGMYLRVRQADERMAVRVYARNDGSDRSAAGLADSSNGKA